MTARYFQGASLTGTVRAGTARSFREVVDALRLPPRLGMSRADFLALDEKKRNEAKQVPFFVPACFKQSPSKRVYAEATHCNLIFLDIDPEKRRLPDGKWEETGRYPAAPFVRDPERLHTLLEGFNFAAHVTASSTPERPRMRIIVDASDIPLARYPAAVHDVASRLGLPLVTRESTVAVQPMFLPIIFSDTSEEDYPLLCWEVDGRSYTVKDIITEDGEAATESKGNAQSDDLDFLRAPVPEVTLAIAKDALSHLDADCSRDEWLQVAAALKHQFYPRQEEDAYTLFDEWSAQGVKYGGGDETEKLWKSLRPTPTGRLPVTIRTLLHAAVAAGWDDQPVKEDAFRKVYEWFDEARSITDLMEHGVKRILGAPQLSTMQVDTLAHQLAKKAKERFAYTISLSAIRKDLERVRELMREKKPPEKLKEPLWAKGVCYIANTDEFYRQRTGERYKSHAFNSSYARWLLPTEDMLRDRGEVPTPALLARPVVEPSVYALNHLKIPTVYDYAYDPSQPMEMFFVDRGRKYVNTYSPTYPELDAANTERVASLVQRHLGNLIAEDDYRRTIIDFMAYQVQFPGRKVRWAVLIQSAEGAGKTFLAELMKTALGAEHVRIIGGEEIKRGWNEWAFGSQLVVLEEVRVAGANRHEIMNALKPLITNDDISINERNRNTRQAKNITNYMLFSNHHNALTITPNDRRYFVVKSPLQHKGQVQSLGENYFAPIYAALREYPGAVRSWLNEWTISPDFRPDGHAPRTTYLADLVEDSASDVTAAVRRLMREGDHPLVQYDIVGSKALMDMLSEEDNIRGVTPHTLTHVLREEGMEKVGRITIGEERQYIWVRHGVNKRTAPEEAARRVKNNLKNLEMQLFD